MQQLSGSDASFLYLETPSLHMHTLKVVLVDPSEIPGGFRFESMREVFEAVLPRLPQLRRRVQEIPFGLHHPVWVDDADFDLAHHLRRATAPSPGGLRELCAVVSAVASRPLDRAKPLWETTAVDGLADGRLAFIVKIHHAMADGGAAVSLLTRFLSSGSEGDLPAVSGQGWRPQPPPTRAALLGLALRGRLRNLATLPRLLIRAVAGLVAVRRRRQRGVRRPGRVFHTPSTPFGGSLSADRTFVLCQLPMATVLEVKKVLDVSVNDVVLAICAGALRSYLLAHDALPAHPLIACVPVGVDAQPGKRFSGNQVASIFTELRTDLADSVEGLFETRAVTEAGKEELGFLGPKLQGSWNELIPPRPAAWFMRQYSRLHLADRLRSPANLVVSNVRGPSERLELGGARLDALYSVGPILEGIGLNMTAWSYRDQLDFGLLACPLRVPDLWSLAEALPAALESLRQASAARRIG